MSNVLDLFDQTFFTGERATGATGLLQCVWVYDRAIDIDGLRQFHRHLQRGRLSRRIERSPLPFGRHRWVSPSGQSDLEIVATPRPREEFDAWLGEQANTPPGRRARTRMAPRGAPVHRRRRRGEPGHLTLPHRRRRAVRGVGGSGCRPPRPDQLARCRVTSAVASRARGRPPNRPRPPRYRPRRRQPRHDSPDATSRQQPAPPPSHLRCPPEPTNPSLSQRQRSSSTPTSGTPAHTPSAGPATPFSRLWRPGSPSEWDGSPQTGRSRWRCPSTSAPPTTPAPTRSRTSTSRSTPHPRRRTCAKSGRQPSKR